MRPSILHIGGTIYWTLFTRNPDTMVLKDADSTPTVAVRKNGAAVGDSVTVTKRSATTGIYDCSYNPAAEVEGDVFTLEESATVTGTTTAQATYVSSFNVRVLAVERGTDGANTTAPATPTDVNDAETAILAAIDGSGTGARTVTITVNDGAAALQNATVRLTEGVNTYTALTNASGVATFNVNDATYTVAITKASYSYAGTTLVVNGDEAVTYSMTAVVVTPPSSPSLTAIEVLCIGSTFAAQSGIDVDFRMVNVASGDQNMAYPGAKVTVTSNSSGIARWEAPQGATIEYKRGAANLWTRVTLDEDAATNVTSIIGSP